MAVAIRTPVGAYSRCGMDLAFVPANYLRRINLLTCAPNPKGAVLDSHTFEKVAVLNLRALLETLLKFCCSHFSRLEQRIR